jgi:stearoyl-CoA desaturase (delta-9 desaturase)
MKIRELSRTYRFSTQSLPFLLFHLLAPLAIWWDGFSWEGVGLAVASYYVRMFGITAGYHRYFSHRSFKTGRVMQTLLALLAQSSAQQGVLWWGAHHRHHHRHSDLPGDIHSPKLDGFWHSHVGWILVEETDRSNHDAIRDFAKYPELRFLDRYSMLPAFLYAVILTLIFGRTGLCWGFVVSTVVLWHGTFTINSLSHVFGSRVYETTDTSRNNALLAMLTLGEGWHNNHHYYQRSAAQGWRWYELDITYLVLRLMQAARLVSGVGRPPKHIIEGSIRGIQQRSAQLAARFGARIDALHHSVEALRHRAELHQAEWELRREHMRTEFEALGDEAREALRRRHEELLAASNELRGRAHELAEELRAQRDLAAEQLIARVEQALADLRALPEPA